MEKKLYRSTKNKLLAGVCAGIAEYFNIDPTIVRVATIITAPFIAGLISYIICIFIIPRNEGQKSGSGT